MSLIGALNTGQSALATAQASIQVIGNNISNAGNANYSEETTQVSAAPGQEIKPGVFVGSGVDLTAIQRQVDAALDSRLDNASSDSRAAQTNQQWLTQVQSTFNALNSTSLSSSMSAFFNSWSTLANSPQDVGQRQIVLQQGAALAQQFNSTRQQLTSLNSNVGADLQTQVKQADTLASQIANLNGQIVNASVGGSGSPNALMDQRDAAISQLSSLMKVTTQQQPDGSVNVYAGSQPLVVGTQSNGVSVKNEDVNGVSTPTVIFTSNSGNIPLGGAGQLGALTDMQARITGVVDQVDTLAHSVISQVNQVYSSGQGLQGYTNVTAASSVSDTTQPLNGTAAGLKFTPTNGSFVVHVTDPATGATTSTLVQVNLNGSSGGTTLDSLTASLNAISGVSATDTGGTLKISTTNSSDQITFSQDSSGTLAALGINTFFTGSTANDMAVNSTVSNNPQLLAAAQNGDPGDNQTAVAISQLATQSVPALGGQTLNDNYQSMIDGVSTQLAAATSDAQSAQAVQQSLQAQRDSISGVSIDDEAIKLMKQQQAYQGAAQLINVVNTLMQATLAMVTTVP